MDLVDLPPLGRLFLCEPFVDGGHDLVKVLAVEWGCRRELTRIPFMSTEIVRKAARYEGNEGRWRRTSCRYPEQSPA